MNTGVNANNYLASILGIPGGTVNGIGTAANDVAEAGGAPAGYNNYLQMAGYAPAMREMSRGVTGTAAAGGLLNSGSTGKAFQSRGADINQGFFNNYLQQLNTVAGNGLQAGGLVSNAGQKSTSTGGSPSTVGSIASTVGGIASIFSDRRLKTHIVKIGVLGADGLGLYRYRYIGQIIDRVGVMADEIAKLRPWALGRTVAGFQTVNYGAL